MRALSIFAASVAVLCGTPAQANDWEKFFTRSPSANLILPSTVPAERINSQGSVDADVGEMWKKGFVLIGYTAFSTGNSSTKDAERLANKLKARYYIAITDLTSSYTTSIPMTTPSSTMSTTTGNFSVSGTSGMNSGQFSGTTTTLGSRTTYIPLTVNRFSKLGLYFGQAPHTGTGIYPRELSQEEISKYETQRGFVVVFLREGAPAYEANVLPGDVITDVNGSPADATNWMAAVKSGSPLHVKLFRNGEPREITIVVPPDWRPN